MLTTDNGQMTDGKGYHPISSPRALVSGELKIIGKNVFFSYFENIIVNYK